MSASAHEPVRACDLPSPAHEGTPYRIIMVCTGNICRSAMAHSVLVDRLACAGVPREGVGAVVVSSAGVSAEEQGNPMDRRARRVLADHGYGEGTSPADQAVATMIATHRAQRITDEQIRRADLMLAMTRQHYRELCRRAHAVGVPTSRIRLFREFDPAVVAELPRAASAVAPTRLGQPCAEEALTSAVWDVPDPWYGTVADFVDTLAVTERVSDALLPALQHLPQGRR